MPYDERWLDELPITAEMAALRLQGLAYLAEGWATTATRSVTRSRMARTS